MHLNFLIYITNCPYILDAFTSTVKNFIMAFLTSTWMVYFAAGIGFLDSTTTTVMRSMIISVVPVTEIGKVFCIVEFFKGILPFFGAIIYGKLYEHTVRTAPAAFLYLSSCFKCMVFIVGVIIYNELNKRETRRKIEKYSHKKDDISKRNDKRQESDQMLKDDTCCTEEPITPTTRYDPVPNNSTLEIHYDPSIKISKISP